MGKLKKALALVLVAALMLVAAACDSSDNSSSSGSDPSASASGKSGDDTIVIYDGQFAEMQIIHQMVKLLVEERTDAKVEIRDQMAPVNSYNEMLKGSADLMNCYDGTLLTTFLKLDTSDVPEGTTLYDFVNKEAEAKGVMLLDKLGLNNTYIIAVPDAIAEEYNLVNTSDLADVAGELVFGAEHDFFTEEGSAKYNPFIEFYGLSFKDAKQIDMSLKYSAVDSGSIDVTVAYATDGRNLESNLTLLKDDLGFFPEYNGALLVRSDLFDRLEDVAPNLKEVLNMLGGIFTDEDMVKLSYEVDFMSRTPLDVAQEYLRDLNLIS